MWIKKTVESFQEWLTAGDERPTWSESSSRALTERQALDRARLLRGRIAELDARLAQLR